MIASTCTCNDCKLYAEVEQPNGHYKMGAPLKPKYVPGQFKWKPMIAGEKSWAYLLTCKICKWEKFSDYYNAEEWMWFHHADDCKRPYKKWSN